jgi:peptidoglycan/xylan/chitin deacetylase (PgdA/CDA1 family)
MDSKSIRSFQARARELFLAHMGQHRTLRVLCYHVIADLAEDPVLKEYCTLPATLETHLATLRRLHYQFVTTDQFLSFMDGGPIPRRAVLVTFDDAYADLRRTALPVLERFGIQPVLFPVSRHLGGTNEWDQAIGAGSLRLMDSKDLVECVRRNCEIGSHSRTHPRLTDLGSDELVAEFDGALDDLEAAGLPRPRLFAYPYGAHNRQVRIAARRAGLVAAFTVQPGWVRRSSDRLAVPRIELMRNDTGWQFRLKIATAGLWPTILQSMGTSAALAAQRLKNHALRQFRLWKRP